MKKYLVLICVICFSCFPVFAKDNKAIQAEKKQIEKEEKHYQKQLRKRPESADTYWHHANNLLAFKSEASHAIDFYKKALTIDSVNGALYKDFGKYLYDRMHKIDYANEMLTKAAFFLKNDEEVMKYLVNINTILEARNKEAKLRFFGTTNIQGYDSSISYKSIVNFDSLIHILLDSNSNYYYQKLLNRFLSDDNTLTPKDMYLLMVGYSKQPTYNPFNYGDISALRGIPNMDTAINRANEVMVDNPVNPSLYRELMYFYRKKNNDAMANKYLNRMHQIFNGMLYSGNGTCKRPYVTLWAKEEYNFAEYIAAAPTDNHSLNNCEGQIVEVLEVTEQGKKETKDIYFNVQLIYSQTMGK